MQKSEEQRNRKVAANNDKIGEFDYTLGEVSRPRDQNEAFRERARAEERNMREEERGGGRRRETPNRRGEHRSAYYKSTRSTPSAPHFTFSPNYFSSKLGII